MLALRRAHTRLSQALIYFPVFLGFRGDHSAPGEVMAPYAASERKFLPTLISHLTSIPEHPERCLY